MYATLELGVLHVISLQNARFCRSANSSFIVIVKASSGPRYVVGCRKRVEKKKLIAGTRVALDMTTLTIMRVRRPYRRRSRQSFSITARTKPHGRVVVHA